MTLADRPLCSRYERAQTTQDRTGDAMATARRASDDQRVARRDEEAGGLRERAFEEIFDCCLRLVSLLMLLLHMRFPNQYTLHPSNPSTFYTGKKS